MARAAPAAPGANPRWWSTLLYIPALYLAGFALSRPLSWLQPAWRADQVDLAGVGIAFVLLLLTLPSRLLRVWGSQTPWASLGLRVEPARGLRSALLGLAKAATLLTFLSLGLLLTHQARWVGTWPAPPRLLNALALGCGVGLAEELLFRGWLWGELRLMVSARRALLLQACIFALVHPWYREPGLLALSLLGGLTLLAVCLGLERRAGHGSLWGAATLHGGLVGGWFLLQSGLLEVSPGAPGWWAGPGQESVNPVGGLLGWIGLLGLLYQQGRFGGLRNDGVLAEQARPGLPASPANRQPDQSAPP
jgi:membrane protease YdiL (CAAX protease family)